jgi:hypothetical protein
VYLEVYPDGESEAIWRDNGLLAKS